MEYKDSHTQLFTNILESLKRDDIPSYITLKKEFEKEASFIDYLQYLSINNSSYFAEYYAYARKLVGSQISNYVRWYLITIINFGFQNIPYPGSILKCFRYVVMFNLSAEDLRLGNDVIFHFARNQFFFTDLSAQLTPYLKNPYKKIVAIDSTITSEEYVAKQLRFLICGTPFNCQFI